jgi:hypothetical protein
VRAFEARAVDTCEAGRAAPGAIERSSESLPAREGPAARLFHLLRWQPESRRGEFVGFASITDAIADPHGSRIHTMIGEFCRREDPDQ